MNRRCRVRKNKKFKELKKQNKDLKSELLELQYAYIHTAKQAHILKSLNDFLSNKIQSRGQ